jgi:hypothetical protein
MRHAAAPIALALALALGCSALALGCAAPARDLAPRGDAAAPAAARPDSVVVAELRMRRGAELADGNGALRVLDQDLRLEYRPGGRGRGVDAGEVTFDGRPLRRETENNGAFVYRAGRELTPRAGENPWITIANSGAAVPADTLRVKIAAFPTVTRPLPAQAFGRGDEIAVVTLPPLPDLWQRVSLTGAGDTVAALDMGEGRWLFPRGSLERFAPGAARILIEIETSCAVCPAGRRLPATWSTRAELEIPVTLI